MQAPQLCQYCSKQASHVCSQCKWTPYCSREHQLEHWRIHRQHCTILNSYRLRQEQGQNNGKRAELRKKYFQNYMHKIYDACVRYAEELIVMERRLIDNTREIFNQMEYGISVCLLARSYINIRNQAKAAVTINNYLEEKLHFLKDMRDITNFESLIKKQLQSKQQKQQSQMIPVPTPQNTVLPISITISIPSPSSSSPSNPNPLIPPSSSASSSPQSLIREFAIKKVSLISSVSNILYSIPTLRTSPLILSLYQIYTAHIQKMFGRESLQTSNCYFMIGTHYLELKEFYKSIACFMRAAEIRGNMAGDCYYNLGILFHLLKNGKLALMMFQNAAKLKENQFSQNSAEVADVYHNIALIHQSMGNYRGAIQNLEKIVLIYSKDKASPQYRNAKESIKLLEGTFRKHMEKAQASLAGGLMSDIKKTIRKASKAPDDALSQNSFRQDKQAYDRQKKFDNNYLRLSDDFISKLNSLQSYHLSQLQIQLTKCETIYMAASTISFSHFLRVVQFSKLQRLIKDNENLFRHVSIQMLSKRGIKDINKLI